MSVTTKSSTVTASAPPPRAPALTQAQRETLQKFTVWRNSLDDRGDLFGSAAINAMLLQDIVGELARAADELGTIANKQTPAFPSFADVQTYVAGLLEPINLAIGKHQAAIDALASGAAKTATDLQSVQHRTDALEDATRQGRDEIETLKSHLSRTDQAVGSVRQQLERIEEHLLRHDRDRDALRQRLDALTGNVERFVAETDWELIRGLITLEERVKCLEDAEPRPGPQSPTRVGPKRT